MATSRFTIVTETKRSSQTAQINQLRDLHNPPRVNLFAGNMYVIHKATLLLATVVRIKVASCMVALKEE